MKSLSRVRLLATPRIAAHQAPPPMGFSRQEYSSGVPLPSPHSSTYSYINISCKCLTVPPIPHTSLSAPWSPDLLTLEKAKEIGPHNILSYMIWKDKRITSCCLSGLEPPVWEWQNIRETHLDVKGKTLPALCYRYSFLHCFIYSVSTDYCFLWMRCRKAYNTDQAHGIPVSAQIRS